MQEERKPSNIIVVVPDLSGPAAQALEAFNRKQLANGDLPASRLEPRDFGYVQTVNGMFVLCREGVGDSDAVTETNRMLVDFYAEWDKPEGKTMECLPSVTGQLTDTEIIMLPTKSEEPLEKFIRSFGRRLEANYEVWLRHFSKNQPMSNKEG